MPRNDARPVGTGGIKIAYTVDGTPAVIPTSLRIIELHGKLFFRFTRGKRNAPATKPRSSTPEEKWESGNRCRGPRLLPRSGFLPGEPTGGLVPVNAYIPRPNELCDTDSSFDRISARLVIRDLECLGWRSFVERRPLNVQPLPEYGNRESSVSRSRTRSLEKFPIVETVDDRVYDTLVRYGAEKLTSVSDRAPCARSLPPVTIARATSFELVDSRIDRRTGARQLGTVFLRNRQLRGGNDERTRVETGTGKSSYASIIINRGKERVLAARTTNSRRGRRMGYDEG